MQTVGRAVVGVVGIVGCGLLLGGVEVVGARGGGGGGRSRARLRVVGGEEGAASVAVAEAGGVRPCDGV